MCVGIEEEGERKKQREELEECNTFSRTQIFTCFSHVHTFRMTYICMYITMVYVAVVVWHRVVYVPGERVRRPSPRPPD